MTRSIRNNSCWIDKVKMKDPNVFTVAALKEKLRQFNLSTAGTKSELILRLNEADPSGQWINDIDGEASATAEGDRDVTERQSPELNERMGVLQSESSNEREAEFARRERELLLREIELMRRENKYLRTVAQTVPGNSTNMPTSRVSLSNLKKMISPFDGKKGSY